MIRLITNLLFICLCVSFSFGQYSPKEAKALGEMYVEYEKYNDALPLLLKAENYLPKDMEVKYLLGICYDGTNRPAQAERYMKQVLASKKPPTEAYFYLAKSLHDQLKFRAASTQYKIYLGKAKEKGRDESLVYLVKNNIKRCVLGDKMLRKDKIAIVEQILDLSTTEDEFAPITNPRSPNSLYFTAKRRSNKGGLRNTEGAFDTIAGKPLSDIFVADLNRGEWSTPAPLGTRYNSRQNDVLNDFTSKGGVALLSRGISSEKNDLYLGDFTELTEAAPFEKMPTPASSEYAESSGYLYRDNVLFFVSNRTGGYGGKDIYYTMRDDETGMWSPPINLGPNINSKYDEETPFLAKNGKTIYFSSNNLKSIGGYDIFKADFIDSTYTWTKPHNLGLPVNSPGDDMYFRLNDSGIQAYFSSQRDGGTGGQDLYIAYFNNYQNEQKATPRTVAFYETKALNKPEVIITPAEEKPRITVKEEIRVHEISPVLYNINEQRFSPAALLDLNKLAELMVKYPQLTTLLTAHTDNAGLSINNLYFSAKRGETVAKYLIEKGVNPSQIIVKGCGSNYPQALNTLPSGAPNQQGQLLNRRVNIKVYNAEGTPVRIKEAKPTINAQFKDAAINTYQSNIKGLSYKVQVKQTRQRFDDTPLQKHRDTTIEIFPASPKLSYTTGLKRLFSSADRLRLQLVQEGFDEAAVIPYIDGRRLAKEELEPYAEQYADLRNYIKAIGKEASKE